MHCLTVEYPMPENPEAFRTYYHDRHIPLAERLPGLERYEIGYPAAMGPDGNAPFCVFRAFFADAGALQAALYSEQGAEVAQDVPNYSPRGARMYHYAL